MKIYWGNTGDPSLHEIIRENDWGVMLCTQWRNIDVPYFAIDNGAYSAYLQERPYVIDTFLRILEKAEDSGKRPDFAICPDIVAGGLRSLELSLEKIDGLRKMFPRTSFYLAVQDGMFPEILRLAIKKFDGIFIGGTTLWKHSTSIEWIRFGKTIGKPVHIGRIYTLDRVLWAQRIGADSIDSTGWGRNNTWKKYLIGAREQEILNIEMEENL